MPPRSSADTPPLLPCPFCGNTEIIFDDSDNLEMTGAYGWFAVCDATGGKKPGCGASSGWHATKEESGNAWNVRAAPSEKRTVMDEMKHLPNAGNQALQTEKRRMSELVPTNWLDPLLTGPEAVIRGHHFDCQDIERLLRALKKRIEEAERG